MVVYMKLETYKKYELTFNIMYVIVVAMILFLTYGIDNSNILYGFAIAFIYSMITKIHAYIIDRKYDDYKNRTPILFTRFIHHMSRVFYILTGLVAAVTKLDWDLSLPLITISAMSFTLTYKYSQGYQEIEDRSDSSSWYINRFINVNIKLPILLRTKWYTFMQKGGYFFRLCFK